MTIRTINGRWYQVLSDVLYKNIGHTKDTIVIGDGGDVILLRELDYTKPYWNIQDVKNEIADVANSTKWRSEERRTKTLQYYRNILNIMTGYIRNQTIDNILRNEDYNYDTLCLAC
jgi:hypothetical protein